MITLSAFKVIGYTMAAVPVLMEYIAGVVDHTVEAPRLDRWIRAGYENCIDSRVLT